MTSSFLYKKQGGSGKGNEKKKIKGKLTGIVFSSAGHTFQKMPAAWLNWSI